MAKSRIYAEAGAEWMWIIDPDAKFLEARKCENKEWLTIATHSGNDVAHVAPFEAVELSLETRWI